MSDKYGGRYPTAWSKRDISLYEQFGREPSKTSNGLWVGDVEREAKPLNEWSLAELYALASGELLTNHTSGTSDFYVAVRSKAIIEDKDAIRWGEEDLDNWLLFEKVPEKTINGNFVNDPDRWTKDATEWNDSELIDLGMGFFGTPEKYQMYAVDEACSRFDLPMGITFEEYCEYIQKSHYPKMTSTGVLVNDRTRADKEAQKWTDPELHAWVLGEIESDNPDLLKVAISHFGGEWYWGIDELRHWVSTEEVPSFTHDYATYTDEQLKTLIESGDEEAKVVLTARYPVEEVVDEVAESNPAEDEVEVEQKDHISEPVTVEEVASTDDDSDDDGADIEAEAEIPADDETVSDEPVKDPVVITEDQELVTAFCHSPGKDVIDNVERRKFLSASEWTAEELIGWVCGLIPMGMNVTHATLMAAIRVRCTSAVDNWTDNDLHAYFATGKLPEGFESGVLLNDRNRDKEHPADWSAETLRAWAQGKANTSKPRNLVLLSARIKFRVPDRYTDEQAIAFIAYGEIPSEELPEITNPNYASEGELIGYLKGDVKATSFSDADVLMAIRSKFRIDPHWTDDHIYNFYRNSVAPLKTTNGVLVEDRLRKLDSPLSWSWDELKALANEEIHADFSIKDDECIERAKRLISVQFNTSAVHWSADEVVEYLKSSVRPLALEDGVFINDPTRPNKLPIEWRDAELKAWLRKQITATEKAPEEDLWEEIYVRFKVPVFWYREDARSYVLNGIRVPSTPSGIYVRDRNRDHRKVEHWTKREIKAWARGQILPGINTDEAALANRAARLFSISTQLDAASIKKRISDIREESMTMTVKFVSEDLKSYAKGREEAGDNAVKAAPYQTLLDRCINRVLRLDGEDFVQGWTELLNFFHEHSKGICSAKKIYTGVGQMAIGTKGLRNFNNLTSVLMSTADPEKRDLAVKRLIKWEDVLKDIPNEKSRQNVLAYYGL